MPTYYIHDNGGRPFQVKIQSNTVKVFAMVSVDQERYQTRPSLTFHPIKVFVGQSPVTSQSHIGNTILLHLKDDIYVFIGNTIFQFRSLAPITHYVSPVGNNDVPYPYAVDEKDHYYLLIEDVMLLKGSLDGGDPYDYYYQKMFIGPKSTRREQSSQPPMIPNFQGIRGFLIGGEEYNLRYYPRAHQNYDWVASWEDFGLGMELILINGRQKKLSRSAYIRLMKDFQKVMGFRPLKGKKVLQKGPI